MRDPKERKREGFSKASERLHDGAFGEADGKIGKGVPKKTQNQEKVERICPSEKGEDNNESCY